MFLGNEAVRQVAKLAKIQSGFYGCDAVKAWPMS